MLLLAFLLGFFIEGFYYFPNRIIHLNSQLHGNDISSDWAYTGSSQIVAIMACQSSYSTTKFSS